MVGVGLLVLVWLVYAPATWLTWALQRASEGHLQLTNETGTFWNGAAEVNWQGDSTVMHWPGRVEWQLRPIWGGASLAVHQADATSRLEGVGRWHWGTGEWLPGEAQGPARLLSGLGTPFTTLQPSGLLSLRWGAGQWGKVDAPLWAIDVNWRQAGTKLAPLSPLGDYQVQMNGRGKAMHLTLMTRQGPLQLSGSGDNTSGRFHFVGRASADLAAKTVLAGFLSILGIPDGEGVRLEWNR